MTGTEYEHDHKRLFSIMDRGFKIVLHREGVSEKIIHEGALRSERSPAIRRSAPRQSKPTTEAPPEIDVNKYPLLKYPGILKIYNGLNKPQKKIILFLIDPANQNQTFPKKGLMMALGYTGENRFNIEIRGLIKAGYVANEDGRYSQNFSKMVR